MIQTKKQQRQERAEVQVDAFNSLMTATPEGLAERQEKALRDRDDEESDDGR